MTCPFCRQSDLLDKLEMTICPTCQTVMEIDDRGECVFVTLDTPKPPTMRNGRMPLEQTSPKSKPVKLSRKTIHSIKEYRSTTLTGKYAESHLAFCAHQDRHSLNETWVSPLSESSR
ncbi:hypothetical protein DESC_60014 [Desulfosarcina cetonica]|nr:hypothetical protein DESC_60014 [Desulfosarcina cetonica]